MFYAVLQLDEGGDERPLLALVAVAPTVALACFIAAVPPSRSGQITRYVALLAAGALFVGAFFAVGEVR
jgi:hypothetical protein